MGEVNNLVGIAFISQYLIGVLACLLANVGSAVKNRFPSGVIFHFMNDQHMGHDAINLLREYHEY